MPDDTTGQNSSQQVPRGSRLQGDTIVALGRGLQFKIPPAWVRWHEENEAHPNLHLTPAELDEVRETEGEWDHEFALVVNAILPFEQCVAHVGGEGWGPRGMSYADLQARVYVMQQTPQEIEARARSQGAAAVSSLTGVPAALQQESGGEWRQTVLSYRRVYGDYGATALVDLRLRRFGDQTVAFAFMYTDHASHEAAIEAILDSVEFRAG